MSKSAKMYGLHLMTFYVVWARGSFMLLCYYFSCQQTAIKRLLTAHDSPASWSMVVLDYLTIFKSLFQIREISLVEKSFFLRDQILT